MKLPVKLSSAEDQAPFDVGLASAPDLDALISAMIVVEMVVSTAGRNYTVKQRATMIRNAYITLTAPDEELPPLPHHAPRHT
jgi:hypothetical protein